MTFDNGTWWLVGGLVSILIYTFGKMINILFNKVIIEYIFLQLSLLLRIRLESAIESTL